MASKKLKRWAKVAAQLVIAVLAIYYVFQDIDFEELKSTVLSAHIGWLFLAFLAFNASKILSAFRLNYFFRALGLDLKERFNLKLYYLGMLYNQFLPGGIGGDGYKVYLLNKWYGNSIKMLVSATLLDRVSFGLWPWSFWLCSRSFRRLLFLALAWLNSCLSLLLPFGTPAF